MATKKQEIGKEETTKTTKSVKKAATTNAVKSVEKVETANTAKSVEKATRRTVEVALTKTRQEVADEINEIVDNGRNTAYRVRTVLLDLLDFSDERYRDLLEYLEAMNLLVTEIDGKCETLQNNLTSTDGNVSGIASQVESIKSTQTEIGVPFKHWSQSSLTDNDNNSILWYSFRGFRENTVNFTFRIFFPTEPNSTNFHYKLNPSIFNDLQTIISKGLGSTMTFVVSVNTLEGVSKQLVATTFELYGTEENGEIRFNFDRETSFDAGDEIFTSIQLHCPQFMFDK